MLKSIFIKLWEEAGIKAFILQLRKNNLCQTTKFYTVTTNILLALRRLANPQCQAHLQLKIKE